MKQYHRRGSVIAMTRFYAADNHCDNNLKWSLLMKKRKKRWHQCKKKCLSWDELKNRWKIITTLTTLRFECQLTRQDKNISPLPGCILPLLLLIYITLQGNSLQAVFCQSSGCSQCRTFKKIKHKHNLAVCHPVIGRNWVSIPVIAMTGNWLNWLNEGGATDPGPQPQPHKCKYMCAQNSLWPQHWSASKIVCWWKVTVLSSFRK